jgi:Fructose-1,6-bisphosphatase/sedoheptulose 1,7-bisphosphatase and related proteins
MATCFEETGIDIFMGIGGAPEGVITAAAVKCMGGDMQAKLNPLSEEEISRCHEMGFTDEKLSKVLYLDDLAKGEDVFFAATGITSGDLLKGVVYLKNDKAKTHSIVMRSKTGTIRFVEAIHRLDKNSIMVDLMDKYKKYLVKYINGILFRIMKNIIFKF